jgi:hypothetical protein
LFDPENDLNQAWRLLSGDAAILEAMGLTGAPPLEIAKRIIKRSQWDDLVTNEKRLCIYFRPSRSTGNEITTEEVLQIDCHVPAKQDYLAYRVQGRVRKILHNYETGGKRFLFDGQLGELPSMPGFICVGSRYCFYSVF